MSLVTPLALLSFPHLYTPRPAAPGGEPRYSVNLLFDEVAQRTPEYRALKQAVAQCIDERWGAGKSQDKAFVSKLRMPFRKTSEREYAGYKEMKNGIFIAPWSKDKPGVVDANRQEVTVPRDVWAGQIVRATVRPFAYAQSGNQGVSFNLNNLQICRTDGVRLDGRKSAVEEFDSYVGDGAPEMADEDAPFFLSLA